MTLQFSSVILRKNFTHSNKIFYNNLVFWGPFNPMSHGLKSLSTYGEGEFCPPSYLGHFSTNDHQIWSIWEISDAIFENYKTIMQTSYS